MPEEDSIGMMVLIRYDSDMLTFWNVEALVYITLDIGMRNSKGRSERASNVKFPYYSIDGRKGALSLIVGSVGVKRARNERG